MIKSQKSRDFELACNLNDEINCFGVTENAALSKKDGKQNYKPRTLIDQTLEYIDPTPNIHTLFIQFNARFFWNVLLPVEVKWSNRMTSCAGICTFHPRNRQCVITISAPLLKLRPRKDLVETLLHEMIHGYLFLTNNNRDRDGHGPEFCKHMNRINKEAGTSITIYHSFHNEVRLYQQHWWRCNGPCQKRAPYFGTVRRAMNRAPGPSDFWWKEHQQTCGGEYVKIKEPENFKAKGAKNNDKAKPAPKTNNAESNIFSWFGKASMTFSNPKATSTPTHVKPVQNTQSSISSFKKLGNSTNNVHGWGTRGPNGLSNAQPATTSTSTSKIPKFSSSGTLGGSNIGRSNLLNKFNTMKSSDKTSSNNKPRSNTLDSHFRNVGVKNLAKNNKPQKQSDIKLVECPVCNNFISASNMNAHIDSCLEKKTDKSLESPKSTSKTNGGSNRSFTVPYTPSQKRKTPIDRSPSKQPKLDFSNDPKMASCPICNKKFPLAGINAHLDKCLLEPSEVQNSSAVELNDFTCDNLEDESVIFISSTSSADSRSVVLERPKVPVDTSNTLTNKAIQDTGHKCLVCDMLITPEVSLNDHLEDCIGTVFNDDSTLSVNCDNTDKTEDSLKENDGYPCPVCMKLIPESSMNEHLDTCLNNS